MLQQTIGGREVEEFRIEIEELDWPPHHANSIGGGDP